MTILMYNVHREHTDLKMRLDPIVWWFRGREGLTTEFPLKNPSQ